MPRLISYSESSDGQLPQLKSKRNRRRNSAALVLVAVVAVVIVAGSVYALFGHGSQPNEKPIILYVNQGNGVVNGSDFGTLLSFSSSHGFNTVFFQVYREGRLLFSPVTLTSFVNQTHEAHLKIFFALYITNASQSLPMSIFGLHEDGVSLDMSSLDPNAERALLTELKAGFSGETAVTTTDMYSTLKPDLLILETYAPVQKQFIAPGVIGSVGVFVTSSQADYQSQLQYSLQNSDGVMVFDYYGLKHAGY